MSYNEKSKFLSIIFRSESAKQTLITSDSYRNVHYNDVSTNDNCVKPQVKMLSKFTNFFSLSDIRIGNFDSWNSCVKRCFGF